MEKIKKVEKTQQDIKKVIVNLDNRIVGIDNRIVSLDDKINKINIIFDQKFEKVIKAIEKIKY